MAEGATSGNINQVGPKTSDPRKPLGSYFNVGADDSNISQSVPKLSLREAHNSYQALSQWFSQNYQAALHPIADNIRYAPQNVQLSEEGREKLLELETLVSQSDHLGAAGTLAKIYINCCSIPPVSPEQREQIVKAHALLHRIALRDLWSSEAALNNFQELRGDAQHGLRGNYALRFLSALHWFGITPNPLPVDKRISDALYYLSISNFSKHGNSQASRMIKELYGELNKPPYADALKKSDKAVFDFWNAYHNFANSIRQPNLERPAALIAYYATWELNPAARVILTNWHSGMTDRVFGNTPPNTRVLKHLRDQLFSLGRISVYQMRQLLTPEEKKQIEENFYLQLIFDNSQMQDADLRGLRDEAQKIEQQRAAGSTVTNLPFIALQFAANKLNNDPIQFQSALQHLRQFALNFPNRNVVVDAVVNQMKYLLERKNLYPQPFPKLILKELKLLGNSLPEPSSMIALGILSDYWDSNSEMSQDQFVNEMVQMVQQMKGESSRNPLLE